jgi:hypothetical protein
VIDLKEMPIDEYNRQLLPESKSTQMDNPACRICKYVMIMLQYIFCKALLLFFKALYQSCAADFACSTCQREKV